MYDLEYICDSIRFRIECAWVEVVENMFGTLFYQKNPKKNQNTDIRFIERLYLQFSNLMKLRNDNYKIDLEKGFTTRVIVSLILPIVIKQIRIPLMLLESESPSIHFLYASINAVDGDLSWRQSYNRSILAEGRMNCFILVSFVPDPIDP